MANEMQTMTMEEAGDEGTDRSYKDMNNQKLPKKKKAPTGFDKFKAIGAKYKKMKGMMK